MPTRTQTRTNEQTSRPFAGTSGGLVTPGHEDKGESRMPSIPSTGQDRSAKPRVGKLGKPGNALVSGGRGESCGRRSAVSTPEADAFASAALTTECPPCLPFATASLSYEEFCRRARMLSLAAGGDISCFIREVYAEPHADVISQACDLITSPLRRRIARKRAEALRAQATAGAVHVCGEHESLQTVLVAAEAIPETEGRSPSASPEPSTEPARCLGGKS